MRKVWLSSTYYLDPKFESLSAASERMFTRLLAFCGNAETEGFMPANVHKLVGLPRGLPALQDLVARGVLIQICAESVSKAERFRPAFDPLSAHIAHTFDDGAEVQGYRFGAWADWQEKGDKLLQRQKADRERKRRQRQREDQESRDTSRDVTPPEKRREEKEPTYVGSSSHVSNANDRDALRSPAVHVDGWKLVRDAIPDEHPHATRTALAMHAGAMLKSGTPAALVSAALALWLTKPTLGPGALPALASEAIKTRHGPAGRPHGGSTADQRFAAAQALKSTPPQPITGYELP